MERELRTTYKLRVHMNFMKTVLDRNIEMFLSHIESLVDKTKQIELPGMSHVSIANVDLRIATPPSNSGEIDEESDVVAQTSALRSDLFIDREEIVMEMEGM